jgi:hypothetical protein
MGSGRKLGISSGIFPLGHWVINYMKFINNNEKTG